MSEDYTVSLTQPTNCANGSITINGPAGKNITYSLNGGAESASAAVPVTISGLAAGSHSLKVNVISDGADELSFTVPLVLSCGYYWYSPTISGWLWFLIILILVVILVTAAIYWSKQ